MDCTCTENMFSDDSSTQSENPFGPAVGEILNVYTCSHKGERGVLYLATKAVCFRRTILFGWEVEKVIVPWTIVETVRGFENGMISINTENDGNRIDLDNFSVDYQVILGRLSKIRSMCREKKMIMDASEGDQYIRRLFWNSSSKEVSAELCEAKFARDEERLRMVSDGISRSDSNHVTWTELCEDRKEIYTETVVMVRKLIRFELIKSKSRPHVQILKDLKLVGCNLDEFYKKFLCHDATFSISNHHKNRGDLDVTETEWENTDGFRQERKIHYNHPINIAMAIAPSAGAATKTQKLQRCGNTGIRIDSETRISNVPMASCFYVADRMLVSSLPGGSISLTVMFGNVFVKSTMFKGIIAATSVRDVADFHNTYIEVIQSASALPISNLPNSTVKSQLVSETNEAVREPKKSTDKSIFLLWTLVLCSFAGHFYFIQQIQTLSAKVLLLEGFLSEKEDFTSAISTEL